MRKKFGRQLTGKWKFLAKGGVTCASGPAWRGKLEQQALPLDTLNHCCFLVPCGAAAVEALFSVSRAGIPWCLPFRTPDSRPL